MRKINQSGFGTLELILLIVILVLVGIVGWLVYNNQHKSSNSRAPENKVQNTQSTSTASKANNQADATANWTSYTSKDGKFSLKYPQTWVTASNSDLCGQSIVLLAPNTDAIGKCGSESFGEISVNYSSHGCFPLDDSFTTTTSKTTLTVSGLTGTKYEGIVNQASNSLGGLPVGTKLIEYCFPVGGGDGDYEANYYQSPSYPDVSSDFNLMVTKTLSFN